jgi:hypothetical protein
LVGHPEKGVVVFTKGHTGAYEFAFDEVLAIEVVVIEKGKNDPTLRALWETRCWYVGLEWRPDG